MLGVYSKTMKSQVWPVILCSMMTIGCSHYGDSSLVGLSDREYDLWNAWQDNRIPTFDYLNGMIDLAIERSARNFSQRRYLLARSPKWSPSLHPRPDLKLRKLIIDSHRHGRIDESEHDALMDRLPELHRQWSDQRRLLTRDRFHLGFER